MPDNFLFTGQIPGMGTFGFGYVDDDSIDGNPEFAKYTSEQKAAIKAKMKELAERLMNGSGMQRISPQVMIQAEREMQNFVVNLDKNALPGKEAQ